MSGRVVPASYVPDIPPSDAPPLETSTSKRGTRRSSLAKWESTLGKARTASLHFMVDGRVKYLGRRKQLVLRATTAVGALSLLILCVHMELRTQESNHDESDGADQLSFDALRMSELVLTVVLGCLVGHYYHLHYQILSLIVSHRARWAVVYGAIELMLLVVGVMPPGVEGTWRPTLTSRAEEAGVEDVVRHVDAYCLLQLARVPLLLKWLIDILLPHVKSPAVLGWQYSVHVPSSFRLKYFVTRHPQSLLVLLMLLTWLVGSFCLHCLEPMFASFYIACYDSWILILDAPPSTPHTVRARGVCALPRPPPCSVLFCAARIERQLTAATSARPARIAGARWMAGDVDVLPRRPLYGGRHCLAHRLL